MEIQTKRSSTQSIYEENICSKKATKDFESFEQERYSTLEECCADKFNYFKKECCDAPDMGGCAATGETVWLPLWDEDNVCEERSKETLALHEETFAKESKDACCQAYYRWEGSGCLEDID